VGSAGKRAEVTEVPVQELADAGDGVVQLTRKVGALLYCVGNTAGVFHVGDAHVFSIAQLFA
jgi:hypothetical protein